MNRRPMFLALALGLAFAHPLRADDPAEVAATLMPESRLWLVGDSTLHAYSSTASEIDVQVSITKGAPLFDQLRAGGLRSLTVRIPIGGLKSGKNQLDKNLRKALKEKQQPDITFRMSSYEVRPSTTAGLFVIDATGDLTVAGQSRPVVIEAQVHSEDPVRISGKEDVLMTDHGVKPPSFMGAVRTHDRVVVNFDLFLK